MPILGRPIAVLRNTSLVGRRPANVWTLIALNLVAGAVSFAAAFAPITMHHFFETGIAFGTFFVVMSALLWIFARIIGRLGLLFGALVCVAAFSTIIANAPTTQGAELTSFGFTWMTIYAASFFSRRDLFVVLVFSAMGCAASFAAFGIHRWFGVWALVMATDWTTGITLERSASRLRREAETDPMTGLLNRRGFFKAASFEITVSARMGIPLAIVLIDLDNFKFVNDNEGHAAGDRLLIAATAAWNSQMRSGDLLARYGGDEFVLLLPENSMENVQLVLDRLHACHPIGWAAGVAILQPGESIERCIERADEHLYQVKMHQEKASPRFKAATG